jgi:hypothetical protein
MSETGAAISIDTLEKTYAGGKRALDGSARRAARPDLRLLGRTAPASRR